MNKFFVCLLLGIFLGLSPAKSEDLPYDYSDTTVIPIKLTPVNLITTRDPLIDGSTVKFRSVSTVSYNGKTILRAGQIINAKLEMNISSGMNGFPAELIFDNFEIPGVKDSQLISTYTRIGQNRCYWVFPLKWALTFLPPTGSLTNFIKGGHANLKPGKVITIYYYPNWK